MTQASTSVVDADVTNEVGVGTRTAAPALRSAGQFDPGPAGDLSENPQYKRGHIEPG